MSYSTLYVFLDDGDAFAAKNFKNGFGSAPRVWNTLAEKYGRVLHPEPAPLPFIMELWQDVWGIEKKTSIPWWEHNVLHWTFDNALIKAEDVPLFIESLRRYEQEFPPVGQVSHLTELADTLSAFVIEAGPKLLAVGHQHTSVSENQWTGFNEELEASESYNMLTGDKHWFVKMLSENSPKVADDAQDVADLPAKDGKTVPSA